MTYTYALDPTGHNPANLVQNEPVSLPSKRVRLFAPQFGAFFTDSVNIIDLTTGHRVTTESYYPAELMELPSALYGAEICSIIVITDAGVSNNLSITYQALGDFYEFREQQIVNQLGAIDDAGVHNWNWGTIIAPVRANQYPPPHYGDRNSELIGYEYLEHAIDRVKQVLIGGVPEAHDAIYAYIDNAFGGTLGQVNTAVATLNAHIANTGNPHANTRDQLNLYSSAEVDAMVAGARAPIEARMAAIEARLAAHISNFSNPHNINASMLGMWSKQQTLDRLNQVKASRPSNSVNGWWQLLVNGYAGSWSHYNDQGRAVMYTFTVSNGTGRIGSNLYVNGQLISDAANYHTNWVKRVQVTILVPVGGTVTIVTDLPNVGPGSIYGMRFVPT